ncbi:MAG: 3-phosphoshikimate 1-carboxyvinyltransferase [Coriobacteriia bacterium]|nr:3-phosphoshikimate 1-carboxyvinyltransferase [Coriobacteriia bacterium]MCL2536822.1 3-phosphoshikimate 1-carboxyvinyltransferase [Coriobacteriia bacterium]
MDVRIEPQKLSGSITAIPSKSYAQRILIAAVLSDAPTVVLIDYLSDDVRATIDALRAMGASLEDYSDRVLVNPIASFPEGIPAAPTVDCRESGTAARLLLPVLTARFDAGTLTGIGSLMSRPFDTLCESIARPPQLQFDQMQLPISWSGKLVAGDYQLPGNISSQYLSGLLFALPLLAGDSTITLTTKLESAGYVDMTLDVLQRFGIQVETTPNKEVDDALIYHVPGGQTYVSPTQIAVEGDWSNSAFWLAADVEVTGLKPDSLQRDRQFALMRSRKTVNATDIPDLVPILAVSAALTDRTTRFLGLGRLRLKESNRIETTLAMMTQLGVKTEHVDRGANTFNETDQHSDEIYVYGDDRIPGGDTVDGANDHRIVMAAAIAGSLAQKPVTITGADAVNKTYPRFFEDFQKLGGVVHVI